MKEVVIFENIEGNNNTEKNKIIHVEFESYIAEAIEQYCKAKKWSKEYFIKNAVIKELIEELGFIQHCGVYLDEKHKPIDFALFLKSMDDFFDKTTQDLNHQ